MKQQTLLAVCGLAALAACSGGGPGSGNVSGGGSIPSTPAPHVQGDMLAAAPSRGWNYQTTENGSVLTISLYADPNLVNGNQRVIVGAAVAGAQPTAIFPTTSLTTNAIGAIAVTQDSNNNYNVVSEISAGSAGVVPGSPLLVPSSLTLGQTWTPYAGVTATVVAVGSMPNANACPTPTSGAQVNYTFSNLSYTIAYVPGCGVTDFKNNANGVDIALISVATYSNIGQLSVARRVGTLSLWDTAQSLLGLRRSVMPAAALLQAGLSH